MIRFEDNYGNDDVLVDIDADNDRLPFVYIVGKRKEEGFDNTLFDLFITDRYEAQHFFDTVDRAKQRFFDMLDA